MVNYPKNSTVKLSDIRKDYSLKSLEIKEVSIDPIRQFRVWLDEAIDAEALEVNAMCLSTIGIDGFPNGRIVLLKELDHGFVFFTNYESTKGKEIDANPRASITFFWPEIERQVRVTGNLSKISDKESDDYFFSRPYGSQIGAWASPQSREITDREEIEIKQRQVVERFEEHPMERPSHWGGYRLIPKRMEFWQGRPNRLHDRICYEQKKDGSWKISRLAP